MSQLILIDQATQQELGRRDMHASERYQLYHDCAEHVPLCFEGRLYRLHRGAWQIPDENFVATVTYQGLVYVDD